VKRFALTAAAQDKRRVYRNSPARFYRIESAKLAAMMPLICFSQDPKILKLAVCLPNHDEFGLDAPFG
jgi:hypothetical protein